MNNKNDTEKVIKILEYWKYMDMLSQDKMVKVDTKEINKYEPPKVKGRGKRASITTRFKAKDVKSALDRCYKYADSKKLSLVGGINVYIGKIDREKVMIKLIDILGKGDEYVDKLSDSIALAAFQMTQDGYFVDNSLSISPILWAVKRCAGNNHLELPERLYVQDVIEMNKAIMNFFSPEEVTEEMDGKHLNDEEKIVDFNVICEFIYSDYIAGVFDGDKSLNIEYIIEFKAENVSGNEDCVDYGLNTPQLSSGFYRKDLEMLIEAYKGKKFGQGKGTDSIQSYILSLGDMERHNGKNIARYNMLPDEYSTDYQKLIGKILDIKNYPIGKWPSKYSPAFMQQAAINLVTSDNLREDIGDFGDIFSVNGPPGTGKTTLLKEIIAENIVRRAELLSKYENPDDAFQEIYKENNKWYRLKDDNINKYGMLVVSNNNGAVENISKELPENISETFDINDKNNDKSKALAEIRKMFDVEEADEQEFYHIIEQKDKEITFWANDIYFSEYADRIIDKKDAWGMISVALGKKRNVDKFTDKILKNFHKDFDLDENSQKERTDRYNKARSKFNKQKKIVEELRERLSEFENRSYSNYKGDSDDDYEDVEYHDNNLRNIKQKISLQESQKTEIEIQIVKRKEELELKQYEYDIYQKQNIFKKIMCMLVDREKYQKNQDDRVRIAVLSEKIKELYTDYEKVRSDIEFLNKKYDDALCDYFSCMQDMYGDIISLDEDYIKRLLSENTEISAKAHQCNPNTEFLYDREREKLFYYAIKMNKAFILSSKCFMHNMNLLEKYLSRGVVEDMDNKEEYITSLMQTLFLMVPVISSTFASIGRFLSNVKPRSLGLLIVDEAGQAEPYMALGALYRTRKAMVVGDPKQIEPVVTDEMDLIKRKIYDDDIYKPYIKKNVSVQNCADYMNSFGKYMDGNRQWVGCPLVVHRRCISPMFDICNELSYNNIMRYAVAEPSKEKCRKFVYESSRWIHVTGTERGNKNHFVEAEWEVVKNIINTSIQKNSSQITNDLFIISPFKSVVNETKSMINKNFADIECINEWTDSHVGTVHTFQGKGASEVVFMLGCDASSKGAVCWVNENIVNVAVSRAKYRLYVIGDKELWYECKSMRILQHRIG